MYNKTDWIVLIGVAIWIGIICGLLSVSVTASAIISFCWGIFYTPMKKLALKIISKKKNHDNTT